MSNSKKNNQSKDMWEAYCKLYNRLEQIKDYVREMGMEQSFK